MTLGWSGGGWSDEPQLGQATPHLEEERYEWRDVLGAGGMGEVHAVYDLRLGREVAMKLAHGDRAESIAMREAAILAQLEHPSIVPVFDVGYAPDGRVYFTMPVVRGDALSDVIEARGQVEGRSDDAILRQVHAASEALAYAHSRGVIHRDIKPANVLVGEYGEVQLVDWGLARAPGVADPFEGSGRVVGTLAYCSPEQAAGHVADARSDVFSLGQVLKEAAGNEPPDDLSAIIARAQCADPSQRYANAGELAADLARFLDGRRVHARHYSSFELLRRVGYEYRRALALVAVGLVVLALGVALAYQRVDVERARAVSAEQQSTRSLEESRRQFALSLEDQSVRAAERGEWPHADVLAVAALRAAEALGQESARARGVLLAERHAGVQTEVVDLPSGCERLLSAAGGLLCSSASTTSLFDLEGRLRWQVAIAADQGASGREQVVLLDGSTAYFLERESGRALARREMPYRNVDIAQSGAGRVCVRSGPQVHCWNGQELVRSSPCHAVQGHALAVGTDSVAGACMGGVVVVEAPDDPTVRRFDVPFGTGAMLPVFSMAFDELTGRIVLGGVGGEVAVLHTSTGELFGPWSVSERSIDRVWILDEERLLINDDAGASRMVDARTGRVLVSLPRVFRRQLDVDGGEIRRWVGRRLWRMRWNGRRPMSFAFEAGLSSAAFDPHHAIVARGDGMVSLVRMDGRDAVHSHALAESVIKRVALAEDGSLYAGVAGVPGLFRVSAEGSPAAFEYDGVPIPAVRRLTRWAGGVLVAPYASGLLGIRGDTVRRWDVGSIVDLASERTGQRAAFVTDDGLLQWVGADGPTGESVSLQEMPTALAVGVDSWAVISEGHVRWHRSGDELRWPTARELLAVAISDDGRRLATSARDGTVSVWSGDRREVARMHDASERVPWVGFAPDGRLATASWDGQLRLYELSHLAQSGSELERVVHAAWGLELGDVLGTHGR